MDKKALSLLRKSGRQELDAAQRQYCMEKDVLWIPENMTHDECIRQIKELAARIPLEKAASAFLYSISSKNFQYRTALASLLWAKALPEHECEKKYCSWNTDYDCSVCGAAFSAEKELTRFDMLRHSRERFFPQSKYMDVSCAGYVLNDLHAFQRLPEVIYCDEDFRILNRIFGLAKEISPTNKVNALLGLITADQSLHLTRADAFSILGVLSSCGVFDTPEHKSYASRFTRWDSCLFSAESDMYYPLNLWRGKHGINYAAIAPIFGQDAAKKLSAQTAICGSAQRELPKTTAADLAAEAFFQGMELPVQLDDRTRYYYGLAPLDPAWEKLIIRSLHRLRPRYTELYFEGDTIRKMVHLETTKQKKLVEFQEIDMDAKTDCRRMLLPKTAKGRPQTLTPSHLMVPTYMQSTFSLFSSGRMQPYAFNCSNDQRLPLPYADLKDVAEFAEYTEQYIASCPENYRKVLEDYRNKKRVTVKFAAGDIFRVQLTPTLYTYCLVLGALRKILKWNVLPEEHPFHHAMTQPIIFRQYALITENGSMTADELQEYPLLEAKYTQDNEILWGTCPIIDRKPLAESDVDFGFWLSDRLQSMAWGLTYQHFDEDPCGIFEMQHSAPTFLSINGMTGAQYMTCSVGYTVRTGIETGGFRAGSLPCPPHRYAEIQKKLTEHFGFSPETAVDEFAERFGGITRKQFIELAKQHQT